MSKALDRSGGEPFSCVIKGAGIDVNIHVEDGNGGFICDLIRSLGDGFGQGFYAARMGPMAQGPRGLQRRVDADLDADADKDVGVDVEIDRQASELAARVSAHFQGVPPVVLDRVLEMLRGSASVNEDADESEDEVPAASDPSLRMAVASDLREMWDAMWATGPRAREGDPIREAEWGAWIASSTGQRIIDESLGGFSVSGRGVAPMREERN